MYGTIKFYIDKFPKNDLSQETVETMENISKLIWGGDVAFYHYLMFDPLAPDEILADKTFPNTIQGRETFCKTKIPLYLTGLEDVETPSIIGKGGTDPWKAYEKYMIRFFYWNTNPYQARQFRLTLTIHLDYSFVNKRISFSDYSELVGLLQKRGYHINNGYYHVYNHKNMCNSFDGITGIFLSSADKRILKMGVLHNKARNENHVADVFFANTLPPAIISYEVRKEIENIVGSENVSNVGDHFNFSICDLSNAKPSDYYWKNKKKIKTLRKVLKVPD